MPTDVIYSIQRAAGCSQQYYGRVLKLVLNGGGDGPITQTRRNILRVDCVLFSFCT